MCCRDRWTAEATCWRSLPPLRDRLRLRECEPRIRAGVRARARASVHTHARAHLFARAGRTSSAAVCEER
eukprot:11305772-Alexandrium_andersonii.AAC.1